MQVSLDVRRREAMAGSIEAIFIAAEAGVPMKSVSEARLEEGQGIVGDRYYAGVRHLFGETERPPR